MSVSGSPLASTNVWDARAENSQALFQPGGPGHRIFVLDPRADIGAASGGGRSYNSLFRGTNFRDYVRTIVAGNPERVTVQINDEFQTGVIPMLYDWIDSGCLADLIVLTGCGVRDKASLSDFKSGIVFIDGGSTDSPVTTNNPLRQASTPTNLDVTQQANMTAAVARLWKPLVHSDASGDISTAAINQWIAVGRPTCPGDCYGLKRPESEYLAITDAPGGGYTAPRLFYSYLDENGTRQYVENILTGIADGNGLTIALAGDYILIGVSGADAGLYYVTLADAKAGTATGVEATGVGTNQVNWVNTFTPQFAVAVGQGGAAWVSGDGGFSWTVLMTAGQVTTENLTRAVGGSENLIWITGENATILRYRNKATPEAITVSGIGADDVLCARVPDLRASEIYVGTSGGEVWRSMNADAETPSWEQRPVPVVTGGSTIDDMDFGGIKGNTMFLIQTNTDGDSRVIIDRSGGYLATYSTILAAFNQPANNGFNSIAAATENYAMVGGEIESTYGYIGIVS